MLSERVETKGRLVAKLVRDLLAHDTYATVADLTDALKARCSRLHMTWTAEDINEAYRLIESNTPLLAARCGDLPPRARTPSGEDLGPGEPQLSHAESCVALQGIRDKLGAVPTPHAMPAVRRLTDDEIRQRGWTADQRRAYLQVQAAIRDLAERVAQLEDEDGR